jgi:hypothetical protein
MMKLALLSALLFLPVISFADASFQCTGPKSRFELVKGYYQGESSNIVSLNTSSTYDIYSNDGSNRLSLVDDDLNFRLKALEEFPIQFKARQRDDLGSRTTIFAIPVGAFGGRVGKPFIAKLVYYDSTKPEITTLSCELN